MIKSEIIRQTSEYTPVSTELKKALDAIQSSWGYKVIDVYETQVHNIPRMSSQGFIILYETDEKNDNESAIT